MVDAKNCTIPWHVDDLKLSHVQHEVLDCAYEKINERFSHEDPAYDSWNAGQLLPGREMIITLTDFIGAILRDASDDMEGESMTPVANHLFTYAYPNNFTSYETSIK